MVAFTTPPFAQEAGVNEVGRQLAPLNTPPEHAGGGPTGLQASLVALTKPFAHAAGLNWGGVQLRVVRLSVPPFEHVAAVTVG